MLPTRLFALAAAHTARPIIFSSYRSRHYLSRSFSVTPRQQATPSRDVEETRDIDQIVERLKSSGVIGKVAEKLAGHPDAIKAFENLINIAKNAGASGNAQEDFKTQSAPIGIDVAQGKPPSTIQMIKLASNAEFRQGVALATEEMQKAGVDMVCNFFSSLERVD